MCLSDMTLLSLPPGEGPQPASAVLFLLREGKTNRMGRKEFMGSLRNKDPLICPHGALAQYLFWRFHVSGEEAPSFRRRQSWYDIMLLVTTATSEKATKRRKGASRQSRGEAVGPEQPTGKQRKWTETELAYIAQLQEIWRAFDAAGVTSVEKTHAMRGCAARAAELHGVPDPQVSALPIQLVCISAYTYTDRSPERASGTRQPWPCLT